MPEQKMTRQQAEAVQATALAQLDRDIAEFREQSKNDPDAKLDEIAARVMRAMFSELIEVSRDPHLEDVTDPRPAVIEALKQMLEQTLTGDATAILEDE